MMPWDWKFSIRYKIHDIKQDELISTEDIVLFQKLIKKEWVYDFLVSLKQEYAQLRVQVLDKILFPSIEDVYYYVQ